MERILKNGPLISPITGVVEFGFLGTIRGLQKFSQPGGPIVLKRDDHIGQNHGFGAKHTWAEHKKEMHDLGYEEFDDVPRYVTSIIVPGTPVHCEFAQLSGHKRVTVVRSKTGTAVLEYRIGRNDSHDSVVTVFSGEIKHGPRVGTVLQMCEQ